MAWISVGCDDRRCGVSMSVIHRHDHHNPWPVILFPLTTEATRWSHPEMQSDFPSSCRARRLAQDRDDRGGNGLRRSMRMSRRSMSVDRRSTVAIAGCKRPSPCGYHPVNRLQNVMMFICIRGSDGHECFEAHMMSQSRCIRPPRSLLAVS